MREVSYPESIHEARSLQCLTFYKVAMAAFLLLASLVTFVALWTRFTTVSWITESHNENIIYRGTHSVRVQEVKSEDDRLWQDQVD